MVEFELPIKTMSESNLRGHWTIHARRHRNQREAACLITNTHLMDLPTERPLRITLTRIGPKNLDSDNLAGALKHVRDGIADALGIDDGDQRQAVWSVAQARGQMREYSVWVRIDTCTAGESGPQ